MPVATGLMLLGISALACVADRPRGQSTLVATLSQSGELPLEVQVKTGDLLSIRVPRGTALDVRSMDGASHAGLVRLEEARYLDLTRQSGGAVPSTQAVPGPLAKQVEWRRFGAASPAVYYLVASAGKSRWLARIDVRPEPEVRRGRTVRVAAAALASEPLQLTTYDTLEIEATGMVGQTWAAGGSGTGLQLESVRAGSSPGQVILRMTHEPGATVERNSVLEIRADAGAFRVPLHSPPFAAC